MEQLDFDFKVDEVVSAEDLKGLCSKICVQRELVEEMERKLNIEKAELTALKDKARGYFEEVGLEKMHIPGQGTVGTSVIESVSIDDPIEFKKHLRETGQEELLSMNYQTLQALYRRVADEAKEQGVFEVNIPGLSKPKRYTNITVRKER